MKGFSSTTLAIILKELEKNGILSRQPITKFLQELNIIDKQGAGFKESIVSLLHG
jgi:predicted transcriptional regulator